MGWWDNGRLFIYGQNLSGRPLSSSDVGDIQLFSNLDSTISETERPNFTTIAEYWYETCCSTRSCVLKLASKTQMPILHSVTLVATLSIHHLVFRR